MAVNITPINYLQLGKCDALVDIMGTWAGNSAGTEGDFYKEGEGCLGFTLRTIGQNDITYTKTSGTWDLSGIKHLRLWFLCSTPNAINVDDPADPANAGIQFFIGDATNIAYYKVGGKTSYPGGWYNLVIDLSRSADTGTKPTGMLCTKIGLRMNMTAAPKNVDNVWIDNLIYCDGLASESDTQVSFQDFFDKDNAATGAWGVIRKIAGIYYLTGKIQVGIGSGSTSVDFKDTSQTVVFEDRKVNETLYGISAVGNSGVTKLQLGDKSEGAGISGCGIRTQSLTQTPKYTIEATGLATNDVFKLYGCVLLDAGTISLPPAATDREVLNCNFEACAEVIPSTCKMQYCNFISPDNRGARIVPGFDIKDCNFISCPHAVNIPSIGDYAFVNLVFSGNTKDIENSSTGLVTITPSGTSNPDENKVDNTGEGAETVIEPIAVTLTLTGLKEGSEIRIYQAGTIIEEDGIENSATIFDYYYGYPTGFNVDIVVHHLGWLYFRLNNYTLGSADATLPISQQIDRQYENPEE